MAVFHRPTVGFEDFSVAGAAGVAVVSYNKALGLTPRDMKTWFNKANALAAQKNYREALVCFPEAHNLGDPNAATRR